MNSVTVAAHTEDLNTLKNLVKTQGIIYMRDEDDNTPLHICSQFGFTKGAKLLLEEGANVNSRNNDGQTPLHIVASKGFLHSMELLIKSKADTTLLDNQGKKAIDLVDISKGSGCLRLLQGYYEKKPRYKRGDSSSALPSNNEPVPNADFDNVATRPMVNTLFYKTVSTSVTIVSYNILAEAYTKPGYFPYAPQQVLDWSFRCNNLIKEMTELNADVLCLQEVDRYEDLRNALHPLGYNSVFLRRTGRRKDGCATFFKNHLTLVRDVSLSFNDYCEQHLRQDNVALILELRCPNGKNFFVGNTHLYYKDENVKRQQALDIVREATLLSTKNVILCGDFNTREKTFVYEYMHNNGFESLYHNKEINTSADSECPYTSFGGKPLDLDYIFASQDITQRCIRVMRLPDKNLALPNRHHSSDHVPIAVTIAFE
jgi:mRNA deadenylase 3'-5' endonuclease subunit Ccr4